MILAAFWIAYLSGIATGVAFAEWLRATTEPASPRREQASQASNHDGAVHDTQSFRDQWIRGN